MSSKSFQQCDQILSAARSKSIINNFRIATRVFNFIRLYNLNMESVIIPKLTSLIRQILQRGNAKDKTSHKCLIR